MHPPTLALIASGRITCTSKYYSLGSLEADRVLIKFGQGPCQPIVTTAKNLLGSVGSPTFTPKTKHAGAGAGAGCAAVDTSLFKKQKQPHPWEGKTHPALMKHNTCAGVVSTAVAPMTCFHEKLLSSPHAPSWRTHTTRVRNA